MNQADKALLVEAWKYGQFSDDFNWSLAKPLRAAIRRLCEELADHALDLNEANLEKVVEEMQARAIRAALLVILDCVDYTTGACTMMEMVGACLPKQVIEQAREVLRAE